MQANGTIAEFNPFHNGHAYFIKKIKEASMNAPLVVIMSGDFVQRGTPAVLSKYYRTKMALSQGADLVIELPVRYATSSAADFAAAGIRMLSSLPLLSGFYFGSESGNLNDLTTAAKLMIKATGTETYESAVRNALKSGISYPGAVTMALTSYVKTLPSHPDTDISLSEDFLSAPNNLLGIEYLKSIILSSSKLVPNTIRRTGAGYHDSTFSQEETFLSATAIRTRLEQDEKSLSGLRHVLPETVFEILETCSCYPVVSNDFSDLLCHRLIYSDAEELTGILDVSEELANSMKRLAGSLFSFDELADTLKSRNYTLTRIRRCLLHTVLDIKKKPKSEILPEIPLRVLGFRKDSAGLLKHATAPVLTTGADINTYLSQGASAFLLEETLRSSDLYRQLAFTKTKTRLKDDFHSFPVIL